MAGVSETRTQDAVLTTTLANYRKQLIDKMNVDVKSELINGESPPYYR